VLEVPNGEIWGIGFIQALHYDYSSHHYGQYGKIQWKIPQLSAGQLLVIII